MKTITFGSLEGHGSGRTFWIQNDRLLMRHERQENRIVEISKKGGSPVKVLKRIFSVTGVTVSPASARSL